MGLKDCPPARRGQGAPDQITGYDKARRRPRAGHRPGRWPGLLGPTGRDEMRFLTCGLDGQGVAEPLTPTRRSREGSGCWCPAQRGPLLQVPLQSWDTDPPQSGAGGLAHLTAGPGHAFFSRLLFQASSVAAPGCLLCQTRLERAGPAQGAAPRRRAVSGRAARARAP